MDANTMVKTIQIDLDGVLNTYCGNYDENTISAPRKGAKEFLEKLSQNYIIEIFTVRNTNLVNRWLIENKLNKYITNVSNIKNPFSTVIIDDRALRFEGDFEKTYEEIINFSPHWKIT